MPVLDNPKHESFAQYVARGVKQGEAYVKAGYAPNKGAASRLVATPRIADRITEIKDEVSRRIIVAMETPNEETFTSLAEMGIDMMWVAESFKDIYEKSLAAGSFTSANTAVAHIQKLVEIEQGARRRDELDNVPQGSLVNIKEVTAMLTAMKDVMKAGGEVLPGEKPKMLAPVPNIDDILDAELADEPDPEDA